jgi:hypothetical protein
MAGETCPQCGAEVDDQAVLCPRCGTALIPQKTKAELGREALRARRRPWLLVAFGVALVLAAVGAATYLLLTRPAELEIALLALIGLAAVAVPVGAALGYGVYRLRKRGERPRSRPADAEISEAPPTADERADAILERQRGRQREGDEGLKME